MQQPRPPIVVILGHVDHGKTSLLDFIRKSKVVAREAGGITQHIRSFQYQNITFIDTPGHQAFSAMRSRGSQLADLAVLIVAVDDGVQPQTRESVEIIKKAGIPFIVAINKCDLPSGDPDKVKTQLTEIGVIVEDFGGDVPAIAISAKTGLRVPELLEMISLLSQLNPPQADPTSPLQAIVLESRLDSQKGPLATVVVKNGTLKVGNGIRALIDSEGCSVKEALPSTPVEVLGLKNVPEVGSDIGQDITPLPPLNLRGGGSQAGGDINIILRTDFAGSLEAILASLPSEINIVFSGTGDFNESDVDLAKTSGSHLVGFNVKSSVSVSKLAEVEKVTIYNFKIIYELLDQVTKLITHKVVDIILGKAQIIAEFKIGPDRIAGCKVTEGLIQKSDRVRLMRGDQIVGESRVKSLKFGKSDILQAKSGTEFGAIFGPYIDFKSGDVIIALK